MTTGDDATHRIVEVEEGPAATEIHVNASRAHQILGRDFAQAGSPRAPMRFAKGILPAAIVFVTLPVLPDRASVGTSDEELCCNGRTMACLSLTSRLCAAACRYRRNTFSRCEGQ